MLAPDNKTVTKAPSVQIPTLYYDIREQIDISALRVAQMAEKHAPDSPLAINKYRQMNEMADRAADVALEEGFSPKEAGQLMIALKTYDIGRQLALLPYNELVPFLPESVRSEFELSPVELQNRHSFLSALFLEANGSLSVLPSNEQNVILNAVEEHAKPYLAMTAKDEGYEIAKTLREMDKFEIPSRRDFTTARGALEEFYLWGAPRAGFSREQAKAAIENDRTLAQSVDKFLTRLFENSINDLKNKWIDLSRIARSEPVVDALLKWFAPSDSSSGLLDPGSLQILRHYLDKSATSTPYLGRKMLVDNYANYMFGHFLMLTEIDSPSRIESLIRPSSAMQARFIYLHGIEPKIIPIVKDYLEPMMDKVRSKAFPQEKSQAA